MAAIVIFNGMKTPEQAIYSRFTSDVASLQETVEARFNEIYAEKASKGEVFTEQDIYRRIALGDIQTTVGLVHVTPSTALLDYDSTLKPSATIQGENGAEVVYYNWYVKKSTTSNAEAIDPNLIPGLIQVSDSTALSDYGSTIRASGIEQGQDGEKRVYYTWYVGKSTVNKDEVVNIDLSNNELNVTLPSYEDRIWKLRTSDGTVLIDPPVKYNGGVYSSLDDVRTIK